jgi:TatD DNase family protein
VQQAGVSRVYLPHIDSGTTAALLSLETRFPGVVVPMMGLHPCSVNERVEQELQNVEQWLARRRFAAVGEIGLDFHWDLSFKEQQIETFSRQID